MKSNILTSILILGSLILKGQIKDEVNKMILGKWEYNTAYDTIAVPSLGNENNTNNIFLTDILIKRKKAKLRNVAEQWNAIWVVKNSKELYVYLDNNKILKYLITKLTSNSLELREFGLDVSTLGYKK